MASDLTASRIAFLIALTALPLAFMVGALVYGLRKDPRPTLAIVSGVAILVILVWYRVPGLAIMAVVALSAFILWLLKVGPR